MKYAFFAVMLFFACSDVEAQERTLFSSAYSLINAHEYFQARDLYAGRKNELSQVHRNVIEAVLDNVFNRCEKSRSKIDLLLKNHGLPDSLRFSLLKIKVDNAVRLFRYNEAAATVSQILSHHSGLLDSLGLADFNNSLKIWTALKDVPPQAIKVKQAVRIKMEKDVAGLNNLRLSAGGTDGSFIFDTGANLCTASQSTALRFKMKLLPEEIEVGAVTGKTVLAHLAVCSTLNLDSIVMHNVIFLVLPDTDLSFPQISYQINGILGYPVIQAFNEVTITKDGYFIVPKREKAFHEKPNLAMDGLLPLVEIDGHPYSFDTGADHTTLYHAFYADNKAGIQGNYSLQKITFGGAGGAVSSDGYSISHTFRIAGQKVSLENIQVLIEKTNPEEVLFGNIGQDIIGRFNEMTLNFRKMFLMLE